MNRTRRGGAHNFKVWTFSQCHNEAEIIPFFLRHYGLVAERIVVWDDKSNDGSRELLARHPKVDLRDWPFNDKANDFNYASFAHQAYKEARGKADWVMWVDLDEFIYSPNLFRVFDACCHLGYNILTSEGYNMVNDGLPEDDGYSQIWELAPNGIHAPVYGKAVVFQPQIEIAWCLGKHQIESTNGKQTQRNLIKLLHYRYLGYEYTKRRNARNWERAASKGHAWSSDPNYTGEHSAEWAGKVLKEAFPIV